MRFESGEKDAFPCFCVENLLSYINVELSFENVEELLLTRVHMRTKIASNSEKAPLLSADSVRLVSSIPMYHLDLSKDVALLKAFEGNSVFFILFSFRETVIRPDLSPAPGDHVRKTELCLKMDFWA